MEHYNYQKTLRAVWEHAVATYRDGHRDAQTFFNEEQGAFLRSIGATAQEVFDFAEDYVSSADPDFETFALLADRRRSFFLHVQQGEFSGREVQNDELPPKDAEVDGIAWLPRIIVKARAKLRGEMNPDLMYGCGGDRRFLQSVDMHPAEFLALVERFFEDDAAIVRHVAARVTRV